MTTIDRTSYLFCHILYKSSFGQTPYQRHLNLLMKGLFCADNGEDVDGLPTEGVEIACFHLVSR